MNKKVQECDWWKGNNRVKLINCLWKSKIEFEWNQNEGNKYLNTHWIAC